MAKTARIGRTPVYPSLASNFINDRNDGRGSILVQDAPGGGKKGCKSMLFAVSAVGNCV